MRGRRSITTLVIIIALAAWGARATLTTADGKGDHPHRTATPHIHAAPPAEYAGVSAPTALWTDPQALERGRTIYRTNCAVCHGEQGAGDGPAAPSLQLKPGSLRDAKMFAEMSDAYLFWRVSEGGRVEPFAKAGSVMPAWKSELSPDERWAVVAYIHALSGHRGAHVAAEHAELAASHQPHGTLATRSHPEPRGVEFRSEWVTRDHRWQPRGAWKYAVMRDLPQLYREFNGIDFGHAHLAETLLKTRDDAAVEQARRQVLDFIFSSPPVPPDEEQIAPTFSRMAWEVAKTFDWAHVFHRSLYDLFASDEVSNKDAVYRTLLADYLAKPEALTPHRLDHHGALWSFAESKSFRDSFRTFNTQIWAYHWLQAAVYDVQLLGDVRKQRELMPNVIAFYHGYLRRPPVEWEFMPMVSEAAPEFARRFPEAAAIFDNLHMLHDNFDDILARPDLYPTVDARRAAILKILPIYLHRSHGAQDLYPDFEEVRDHAQMAMGPRPPSVHDVLAGGGRR